MKKYIIIGMLFITFTSFISLNGQWAKSYGHKDYLWASPNHIIQTSDRGFLVIGAFYTLYNIYDAIVLKLDAQGEILWHLSWGNQYQDLAWSVAETFDGGYIVGGSSRSGAQVFKLNYDGEIEWNWSYVWVAFGDARSIQQTMDGGYIYLHDHGGYFSIVKLDQNGEITWKWIYERTPVNKAFSIKETIDGGYVVVGYTSQIEGRVSEHVWILKLSADGTVEWQKAYGGEGGDRANSVKQTNDGGYIVAGTTKSFGAGDEDIWVIKLTAVGNIEWQRTYGTEKEDMGFAIEQSDDGGYILACKVDLHFSFIKLNSSGVVEWQKTFEGGRGSGITDWAINIQKTQEGGYVTACSYSDAGATYILVLNLVSDGYIYPNCDFIKNGTVLTSNTNVVPLKTNALPESFTLYKQSGEMTNQIDIDSFLLCPNFLDPKKKKKGTYIRR
jgi:hypothetical protein